MVRRNGSKLFLQCSVMIINVGGYLLVVRLIICLVLQYPPGHMKFISRLCLHSNIIQWKPVGDTPCVIPLWIFASHSCLSVSVGLLLIRVREWSDSSFLLLSVFIKLAYRCGYPILISEASFDLFTKIPLVDIGNCGPNHLRWFQLWVSNECSADTVAERSDMTDIGALC